MDQLLGESASATLTVHVAACVAALVAVPVALLATKGSRPHRFAGRVFVVAMVLVCLTGYGLDADEWFGIAAGDGWSFFSQSRIFGDDHPSLLATALINTIALYLTLSGYRVWRRRRRALDGRAAVGDGVFAVLAAVAALAFGLVGLSVAPVLADGFLAGPVPVEMAVVVVLAVAFFVDAAIDLAAVVRPPRAAAAWPAMHSRKMVMAAGGLVAAFGLRCLEGAVAVYAFGTAVVVFALLLGWFRIRLGGLFLRNAGSAG